VKSEPAGQPVLPHDLILERTVLNAALEWGRVVPGLTPDLFFRDVNAVACRAIQHAVSEGLTPHEPVVRHILTERGQIDTVGSIYLNDIAKEGVRPTDAGLRSIVQQLEDLAQRRRAAQLVIKYAADPAHVDLAKLSGDLDSLRIAGSVGIKSSFRTAKDLAEAAERVEWIVRGYLAKGAITELTGKAKVAGKTTLFAHIVACILDGDFCLGDMARRGPVVYLANALGIKYVVVRQKSSGRFLRVAALQAEKLKPDEEIVEVWEKDPSVQAFTDLLNRAIDKPVEQVDMHVSGELEVVAQRLVAARKRLAERKGGA
jgi:AAA domain